jgi:molybdopterin-guanine dinucleotide biosynthesis protein MobB
VEKPIRLISVVGKKNSGKTTLIVALASEYARRGKIVGTLKHGTHPARLDTEGTDTWRHMNEGLAERVLLESAGSRVMFQRLEEETDPVTLARQYMRGTDIVIAEGFTRHPIPKIEVFRRAEHDEPHFNPSHPQAGQWIAMVSDYEAIDYPFPTFRFSDTAWLVTLSKLARSKAMVIEE